MPISSDTSPYPLNVLPDGRVTVPGYLNGRQLQFLVGTGTHDPIILDGAFVKALGLPVEEVSMVEPLPGFVPFIHGVTKVESVEILGESFLDRTLPVFMDFPHDVRAYSIGGILGASFFRETVVAFDYANKRLTVGSEQNFDNPRSIKLQLCKELLPLPVTRDIDELHIGRERSPILILDTGSILSRLFRPYLDNPKRNWITRVIIGFASRTKTAPNWSFVMPDKRQLIVSTGISDRPDWEGQLSEIQGVVGANVLRNLNPVFDFHRAVCHIDRWD